jgi:hypothetical protein
MLEPAGAVGATSLGTIGLHVGLPLLGSRSVGAGGAPKPLVRATARDLQEPTQATHAALGGLLV